MKKNNVTIEKSGEQTYSYYSRVLQKPFDSIEELTAAEAEYCEARKVKEDAAAQKKADAKKVEDAFKSLNAARKVYKEDLTQLTKEYAEALENLKKAYELGKKDIANKLADAEAAFDEALKAFQAKYENYHMTLRDGDFETTISSQVNSNAKAQPAADVSKLADSIFNVLFGWYN